MANFRYARGRIPESVDFIFSGLSIQRNRLAHRYLNYRWQAIRAYKETSDIIKKFLLLVIEREKGKGD
ncbi:MAG: hypothetical protein J7K02_06755 [Deltaproteobacteria bacterium]|nr:hypothetical protein [Deltaproteobacteria bacterium]